MTLFKPWVGKVIFAQTIGELCVIIPYIYLIQQFAYVHRIAVISLFFLFQHNTQNPNMKQLYFILYTKDS